MAGHFALFQANSVNWLGMSRQPGQRHFPGLDDVANRRISELHAGRKWA